MFEYNMCAGFLGNASLGTRHIADTFGAGAPATTPALSGVRPCKWDWLTGCKMLRCFKIEPPVVDGFVTCIPPMPPEACETSQSWAI